MLAAGCWLRAAGCWLLAVGCWLHTKEALTPTAVCVARFAGWDEGNDNREKSERAGSFY